MIDCLYCGKMAQLVTGDIIYRNRDDLSHLFFWLCEKCDAFVGCHKGKQHRPLGTLAKPKLRQLRRQVHALFDPLWIYEKGRRHRAKAYLWLANGLNIPKEKCHIGMFNQEMCIKAIHFIKQEKYR